MFISDSLLPTTTFPIYGGSAVEMGDYQLTVPCHHLPMYGDCAVEMALLPTTRTNFDLCSVINNRCWRNFLIIVTKQRQKT